MSDAAQNEPAINESIIQVRELSKVYRQGDVDVHALRGANLEVARGEFLSAQLNHVLLVR